MCGQKFPSAQALGGHSTTHTKAKPRLDAPRDFSVVAQVDESLREIAAPLQQQHTEISRRIQVANRDLQQLREARNRIEGVLKKLGVMPPATKTPANGASAVAAAAQDVKTAKLRELIEERTPELMEIFENGTATANSIADWWKDAGVQPPVSNNTARAALEQLRDAGIVRADRVVKGGGMAWALVSRNGTETET